MPAWPTELYDCILKGSLKERAANNTIRTNMDVGPAKIRRRTTANVRPLSFVLKLKSPQVDVLLDFYKDDLYSGSIEFDFVHPRTSEACTCRFTGEPPEYQDQEAVLYDMPISLEILP